MAARKDEQKTLQESGTRLAERDDNQGIEHDDVDYQGRARRPVLAAFFEGEMVVAASPEVRLSFVSRTSLRDDSPRREVRLSEKPDFERVNDMA